MLAGVYADLKDFPSGIIAAEKSCPDVVRGCALLGYMLCETKRDPQRAVELLAKACSEGDEFACMRLGLTYGDATCTPRDQLRASEYYRLACDRREYGGCALLGFQYLHAQGVARDAGKARALLTLACEHSDRNAQTAILCSTAALLNASPQSSDRAPALAARMYELACEAGEVESCAALGGMYAEGDGVPKSAPRALQLLQPACAKKKMKQCGFLTPLRGLAATCARGQFQQCSDWGFSP
jgi:TPR repeat protein